MSKLKVSIFTLFFISLLFFVCYLLVNPVLFGIEKSENSIGPNQTYLKNHVKYLTDFENSRSHKNIDTLNLAADYIYDRFESSNCDKVTLQAYKLDGKEYKNVICRFDNTNQEKIIVGAHYDVHSEYSLEGFGELGNFHGADDNASGVASILELARLVGKNKTKLNNSIEFVAYTLEEQPFFGTRNMGSYIHAKSLNDKGAKIKYMISLESIGYFSDEQIQNYPFKALGLIYPKEGNFIAIIGEIFDFNIRGLKKDIISNSSIPVWSLNSPIFVESVDRSDHRNFWLFGYKAYMITDTANYRNPNYHTVLDTIDTLDFNKMSEVIKGIYGAIY